MTGAPGPAEPRRLHELLTDALRAGTPDALAAAFDAWLAGEIEEAAGRTRYGWDPRETMMDLAPLVDLARRVGVDPQAFLAPRVSARQAPDATIPAALEETITAFLRRTDVTPEAFGWHVVPMDDGAPGYRFRWPF